MNGCTNEWRHVEKNVAYLLQHKVKLCNKIMKVIFIILVMVSSYR